MSKTSDSESPPVPDAWVYYRDLDGATQKFLLTSDIREHGIEYSHPHDDPPHETWIRVAPMLFLLKGVLDPVLRQITPSEAKAWIEARQAFSLEKYGVSYPEMPPELQSLEVLPEGEDPAPTADDERELARVLSTPRGRGKRGNRTPAALVIFMIGKDSASRADVGEHVHDNRDTSGKTIAQNCRFVSHEAETLFSPLRYDYASGMVRKTRVEAGPKLGRD
jgi:hypothetical protein